MSQAIGPRSQQREKRDRLAQAQPTSNTSNSAQTAANTAEIDSRATKKQRVHETSGNNGASLPVPEVAAASSSVQSSSSVSSITSPPVASKSSDKVKMTLQQFQLLVSQGIALPFDVELIQEKEKQQKNCKKGGRAQGAREYSEAEDNILIDIVSQLRPARGSRHPWKKLESAYTVLVQQQRLPTRTSEALRCHWNKLVAEGLSKPLTGTGGRTKILQRVVNLQRDIDGENGVVESNSILHLSDTFRPAMNAAAAAAAPAPVIQTITVDFTPITSLLQGLTAQISALVETLAKKNHA